MRQRVVGNTAFGVGALTASSTLYVFVAGTGNYVGNYPPGTMVPVTTNAFFGSPILRDMGKTITAAVSGGTVGTFRQVQLLNPVAVASATSASNFGVNGSVPGFLPSFVAGGNAGDDGYNTFYIPIASGGVIASGVTPDYTIGPIAANVL
jgi:hypothetical protein